MRRRCGSSSRDVGGGFGLKANLYAEEIALAGLARRLGVAGAVDRGPHREPHGEHARPRHADRPAGGRGRLRPVYGAIDAEVRADVGAYSVWPATSDAGGRSGSDESVRPVCIPCVPCAHPGRRNEQSPGRAVSWDRPERRGLRHRAHDGSHRGRDWASIRSRSGDATWYVTCPGRARPAESSIPATMTSCLPAWSPNTCGCAAVQADAEPQVACSARAWSVQRDQRQRLRTTSVAV